MIYPKVNVIILNWNGDKVLADCIKSILQSNYSNYIVTIIDNGSTDLSLDVISKFHQNVELIKIDKNLGYAKAYNYAFNKIAKNNDDYYFLLNNDTEITNDTIDKLVFATKKYGKNNIYGPKIINSNNNNIWYAGGKLNPLTFNVNHIGLNQKNLITEFKSSKTDFISGCALFISKTNINKLNGFNENYNFYYEDVELCIKAKSFNIDSIFINNSIVLHKISYSMGGRYSLYKIYVKIISKIKFILNNNNLGMSIYYMIINFILLPFFLIYKIIQKFL
tara:strand:+ start:468 stop:1301 length:834 start_codon:yes stop_codon:yes gene_type:complete